MFRSPRWSFVRNVLQNRFKGVAVHCPSSWLPAIAGAKVLVVGVYLNDREHLADHMSRELGAGALLQVVQRWAGLFGRSQEPGLAEKTCLVYDQPRDKFMIINDLLAQGGVEGFDYVLVVDDDVRLPAGFLETYLATVKHFDLDLAQPARAVHSFYDHKFTLVRPLLSARLTRFVEIGPIFSLNRSAIRQLIPFDTRFPMGWGLDYRWAAQLKDRRLGIVDLTPVDHSYRPQSQSYARADICERMQQVLSTVEHLPMGAARRSLKRYWRIADWIQG